jgi:hypothetical protein
MFWKVIERVINLLILMSLILMITILFNNTKAENISDALIQSIAGVKQDSLKAISNNVDYFESRINRLAENQDNYQVGTSGRLSVIEQRIQKLEVEDKRNSRVVNINNNQSNAVLNVPTTLP